MDIRRMSKEELDELNENAKRWREAQETQKPALDVSPAVNAVQAELPFEARESPLIMREPQKK